MSKVLGFVLIWVAAFSCRITIVSVGPLMPLFSKHLNLGGFWGGTLTALPLLMIAVVSVPSGWAADKLGPRVALGSALGLLTIGCMVPPILGPTRLALFANVAFSGIGVGFAQPSLAKVARQINPTNPTLPTTLYANGLVSGGLGAGLLTVPLLNHLHHRWPLVFLTWGLLIGLTGLAWFFIRPYPDKPVSSPAVANTDIGRVPGLYAVAAGFAAQGAVFYALATWLPDFYVHRGWSAGNASLTLAILSIGSVMGGLGSPWLLRMGRGFRRPFLSLSVIMAVSLVGMLAPPYAAYPSAWLVGATTALVFTLGMAAPAVLAPADMVGRASGRLLTLGYIGAVAGPLGFGAFFSHSASDAVLYITAISLTIGLSALGIPPRLTQPKSQTSQVIHP